MMLLAFVAASAGFAVGQNSLKNTEFGSQEGTIVSLAVEPEVMEACPGTFQHAQKYSSWTGGESWFAPPTETKEAYFLMQYGDDADRPWLNIYTTVFSLRMMGTTRRIIVLSTNSCAPQNPILKQLGVEVIVRPMLTGNCTLADGQLRYAKLNGDFTKFHLWALTEFDNLQYIDSDVLVVGNMDELFDKMPKNATYGGCPGGSIKVGELCKFLCNIP
jgi:hypothetical protein